MVSFSSSRCTSREEEELDDDTESAHESSANVKPNIQELEMLLEAYFVQVDGTLNKLCHVCSISFYSLLVIVGLIGNLKDMIDTEIIIS